MANIQTLLQKIMSAIYGEEVRGSIHDAIEAINDEVEAWTALQDGTVTTRKMADSAVTTAKVADGAITRAKLNADVVDTTLAVSGAPADSKKVGDVTADLKNALGGRVYASNTYTTPNQYYRIDAPVELVNGKKYFIYISDLTDVNNLIVYGVKDGALTQILMPGVIHAFELIPSDDFDSIRIVFALTGNFANKQYYAFVTEADTAKNYSALIAELFNASSKVLYKNSPFVDGSINTNFVKSIVIRDYTGLGYTKYRATIQINKPNLFFYVSLEGYSNETWNNIGIFFQTASQSESFTNKEKETFTVKNSTTNVPVYVSIVIDWALFNGVYSQEKIEISPNCVYGQYDDPKFPSLSDASIVNGNADGYTIKDKNTKIITVKKDGSGDFYSLVSAYASIKDSNFLNQYEIVVYPGVYYEQNLIPPAFTHTHSAYPGTVVVSSKGMTGTLPVFDQRYYSKLSGMRIESGTGYCIHYDWESLGGRAIVNEDLYLKKLSYGSIIGGGTFGGGTSYIWRNCFFENGYASCHGYGSIGNTEALCNNDLVFENCQFVQANIDLITTGSLGRYNCKVVGCSSQPRHRQLVSTSNNGIRSIDEPETYFANTNGWFINAYGNKDFWASLNSSGEGLMFTANSGVNSITVTGTGADALFGRVIKYKGGNAYIRATAKGILRVEDKQAGLEGYSTLRDVYQMWKRLGDCSTEPKTITVTTDGTSQTYTFDKNYLNLKPSEASIIAEVNAVITNAVLSKYANEPDWNALRAPELSIIQINGSVGVLKDQMVTAIGTTCSANATKETVYGIALENCIPNEKAYVWTGNVWSTTLPSGEYGVGADGKLTTTATEKIGFVANGCFFRY